MSGSSRAVHNLRERRAAERAARAHIRERQAAHDRTPRYARPPKPQPSPILPFRRTPHANIRAKLSQLTVRFAQDLKYYTTAKLSSQCPMHFSSPLPHHRLH
eukprot:7453991-Pyramimonas_sp.AAC.1